MDLVVTESHEAASSDDFRVRIVENQAGIWICVNSRFMRTHRWCTNTRLRVRAITVYTLTRNIFSSDALGSGSDGDDFGVNPLFKLVGRGGKFQAGWNFGLPADRRPFDRFLGRRRKHGRPHRHRRRQAGSEQSRRRHGSGRGEGSISQVGRADLPGTSRGKGRAKGMPEAGMARRRGPPTGAGRAGGKAWSRRSSSSHSHAEGPRRHRHPAAPHARARRKGTHGERTSRMIRVSARAAHAERMRRPHHTGMMMRMPGRKVAGVERGRVRRILAVRILRPPAGPVVPTFLFPSFFSSPLLLFRAPILGKVFPVHLAKGKGPIFFSLLSVLFFSVYFSLSFGVISFLLSVSCCQFSFLSLLSVLFLSVVVSFSFRFRSPYLPHRCSSFLLRPSDILP